MTRLTAAMQQNDRGCRGIASHVAEERNAIGTAIALHAKFRRLSQGDSPIIHRLLDDVKHTSKGPAESLEKIRAMGYSQSAPERLGADIMGYGVPIFDNAGNVLFVLTAVGRSDHPGFGEGGEFVKSLRREADGLSAKLAEAQSKFVSRPHKHRLRATLHACPALLMAGLAVITRFL
jgi:hypothetical protein